MKIEQLRQSRADDDRGASLVEFALVLPLLAMFLLGIFSVGAAINASVRLNQGVRDSARYGSRLDPSNNTNATSAFTQGSWVANVASLAQNRLPNIASTTTCYAAVKGLVSGAVTAYVPATGNGVGGVYSQGATSGVCWQPTDTTSVVAGDVYIQVSAIQPVKVQYFFGTQTVTLKSRVMMPAEWIAS